MNMLKHLLLLLFLCSNCALAQKVVKKSVVDSHISALHIDVNNCYELSLETSKANEVMAEAIIDGEYKKDLALKLHQSGDTYFISAGFQPLFQNPNDKLSAHKVVSISLKLIVPQYLNVSIDGGNCNVEISGDYKLLKTTLNDGSCTLLDVKEEVDVMTKSGNIYVQATAANIDAETKYGKLNSHELPASDNRYHLSSITGNINITKTE